MQQPTVIGVEGRRLVPNRWDLAAAPLILAALVLIALGVRHMSVPLAAVEGQAISLDPRALPLYALLTTLRMLAALAASLVFTFVYATLAAKSRRAELILIPVLDILQSVPILGFISFTVVFFLGLFPGSALGAECAAIFAIFTSQAWNMAFSFYQALKTVPADLDEVTRGYRFSGWHRFWRLEVPFAMPGLVWNMMLSMSGGWFFVVASEAVTVGSTTFSLPGIGSYLAAAIAARDLARGGLRRARHAGRDPDLRPAPVPAPARLGRPLPARADAERRARAPLGHAPGPADPPALRRHAAAARGRPLVLRAPSARAARAAARRCSPAVPGRTVDLALEGWRSASWRGGRRLDRRPLRPARARARGHPDRPSAWAC